MPEPTAPAQPEPGEPARYGLRGYGRVGSYAKAKQGHYSRSRRYWAITKWSNACTSNCRHTEKLNLHYPEGPVEDPGFPHFKTLKAAGEHLVAWANANLPGGPFEIRGYDLVPKSAPTSPPGEVP